MFRELAIGKPADRCDFRCPSRSHPFLSIAAGTNGRLGMARSIAYRLDADSVPAVTAPLACRNRRFQSKETSSRCDRNLSHRAGQLAFDDFGDDADADDDGDVLPHHRIYADLWNKRPPSHGKIQHA